MVASGRRRRRWSSDEIRAPFNRSEPPGSESVIPLARKSFKVHESKSLDLDQNCFVFFFVFDSVFFLGVSAVSICILMRKSRGVLWVSGLERRSDVEGSEVERGLREREMSRASSLFFGCKNGRE